MYRKILLFTFTIALTANAGNVSIGVNFQGNSSFGFFPPDMGFAVGPASIVQINNGVYQVFSKTGATLSGPISDVTFWANAGQNTTAGGNFPGDPRVSYDPASGRFFASEVNFNGTGTGPNQAFVAVSKDSNPLDGWKAVSFSIPGAAALGDFDTLGLDQNGVYLGTNNFLNGGGMTTSLYSIPKSDLLLNTPSLANMTDFTGLNDLSYGAVPQPALDSSGNHGQILALGDLNQVVLYHVSGSNGPGATLSAGTILNGIDDGFVSCPLQSDGSTITCNIDNRYSSRPFIVGNLMYATNTIGDGAVDDIHWMIINLLTDTVLQQGLIHDPNFFYTYPAIAANASGDFVIGFDRSGATGNQTTGDMQAWAVACHFDGASSVCGPLTELGAGDHSLNSDGRMGDYNMVEIDPSSPNTFWTSIEVPRSNTWSTQITELTVLTPEPASFALLAAGTLALLVFCRRPMR